MENKELTSDFRCHYCGEVGSLELSIKKESKITRVIVENDEIPHSGACPLRGLRKQPSHFKEKKWVKQEKEANTLIGSSPTRNSGAVFGDGDGRSVFGFRVECKGTTKDKFRVKPSVWGKLRTGALKIGEEPVLHVRLGDGTTIILVRDSLMEGTVEIPYKTLDKKDLSNPPKSFEIEGEKIAIISEEQFKCLKTELFPS